MKTPLSPLKSAAIILSLGLSVTACQKSNEDTKAPETKKEPVASEPQATPLPTKTNTPIPTPTPKPVQRKDVRIIGLMIGTGLDKHNEIKNPTSKYHVGDSIFAIVRTEGSGPDATIKVRCKDGAGNILFEESQKITPKGSATTPFTLNSGKGFEAGEYHLEGLLDEYPAMGVGFEVSK